MTRLCFRGAALLGLVVVASACGGSSAKPRSSPSSTTVSSAVVPTTVSATPASSGLPPASGSEVVGGAGALLTPPQQPTVKPAIGDNDCHNLVDDGFTGECSLLRAPSGVAAYVEERSGGTSDTGEARLLVWRRQGSQFALALRWAGTVDLRQARRPSFRSLDLAEDGDPKLVAVFYDSAAQSGPTTVGGVDVVEATGSVVLHRSLDHGIARQATGGGLETWSRLAGSDPLRFRHQVIRFKGGAWRVETSEEIAADRVPQDQSGTF